MNYSGEIVKNVRKDQSGKETITDLLSGEDEGNYPDSVKVSKSNKKTVRFIKKTDCRIIAEIGIYKGHTTLELARHLDGNGELHLFDYEDRVEDVAGTLVDAGYSNFKTYGCSYKLLDSYNWPLATLLEQHKEPIFDYIFIDGAHTWAIDGLTTFLADKLLKPGGYLDFDDHDWTLAKSPALNPETFPLTGKFYTDEQISAQQVKMIIDLIVRRNSRYSEIVSNKIFQKTA